MTSQNLNDKICSLFKRVPCFWAAGCLCSCLCECWQEIQQHQGFLVVCLGAFLLEIPALQRAGQHITATEEKERGKIETISNKRNDYLREHLYSDVVFFFFLWVFLVSVLKYVKKEAVTSIFMTYFSGEMTNIIYKEFQLQYVQGPQANNSHPYLSYFFPKSVEGKYIII